MSDAFDAISAVKADASPADPFSALTARETEVARRLALGAKNGEIAADLNISIKTVDTHRSHILAKLGCRNNVELARLAIRRGLSPL